MARRIHRERAFLPLPPRRQGRAGFRQPQPHPQGTAQRTQSRRRQEAMTAFTIAFASLALLLGIYAFVGLRFGSKWRRAAVSGFFAILLAGLFFGYSDM